MISKRLTQTQKAEILEAYRAGDNTNSIAEKYSCTSNTINRTVKNLLSHSEYSLLKKKRSKITYKKVQMVDNEDVKEQKNDLEKSSSLMYFNDKMNKKDLNIQLNKETKNTETNNKTSLDLDDKDDFLEDLNSDNKYNGVEENNQNIDNDFELIEPIPLLTNFDFDHNKQKKDPQILSYESLPESVYMIVDKTVELDSKLISDLPEWSFLPDNELNRNAIILFSNQRSAKRSCSRNQRVIKIPNTSIFKLSKPYLVTKGITRLILEDSIVALDA
ncbi:helix-turn-helix domain-containing protein [Prochlorococcus marinus]|uniref:helix-turn-helix domain-containing protein n=1 Tax=Prochlorococcus marinus TaxID=1219 RepID=UPI0022B35FF6|nr:hypothetical protein [Prochlorococcus marinus]